MHKYLLGALFAFAVVVVFSMSRNMLGRTANRASAAESAGIPRMPDGKPDLDGSWIQTRKDRDKPSAHYKSFSAEPLPPMQPWAQEKCKALPVGCDKVPLGQPHRGQPDPTEASNDFVDPVLSRCAPGGFPRSMVTVEPIEILQTYNRILIRFEQYEDAMREIWMDGRAHPKEPDRPWMGHSIGKWDGDTLVVDTVGLGDRTWLDREGHPHSDALHVVEHINRLDKNTLQDDFAFEDPKAYTKPWTGRVTYEFRPGMEIREAIVCEDRILAESPEEAWPFHLFKKK